MAKYLISIFIFFLLFINACSKNDKTPALKEDTTSSPDSKNDSSAIQIALDKMMKELHSQNITGNPDYDFAMIVIPHCQGAVDISNAYLVNAKDLQLKKLAGEIISKNRSVIIELKNWSNVYKDTIETVEGNVYRERLNDNMTEMMKHMEPVKSSDPDLDYIVVMIPHHRDAIEMAKIEIDFGKDENLKNLAKSMIKELQEQIRIMDEWRQIKDM